MKKFITSLILFFYTVFGSGFVITTHFCAGEVSSINLNKPLGEKPNCGCDENFEMDFCCKDEFKNFKIENEQKKIKEQSFSFDNKLDVSKKIFLIQNYYLANLQFTDLDFFHPPNKHTTQQINCSFLI